MTRRRRSIHFDNVLDGRALRVQLTAAALDNIGNEAGARERAKRLLLGAMMRGRLIAQERLEEGAGGVETAKLLSRVMDEVISALYDFTTVHVFRSRVRTPAELLSIVATGGYGRSLLAPSSDIDLLFLRSYKTTPWSESVIEYMLYMLWDLGLKVGHASRNIPECLRLAREDHTIATALLDARPITGDMVVFDDFKAKYRAEVAEKTAKDFVAAKLKEREDRHRRAGESRYLVEPNVKEGKGALRDLDSLFWITKFIYGAESKSEFAKLDVFDVTELAELDQAREFLWSVRCHLHFLTGRAEERITFDVQPEMAQRLDFKDTATELGVERFMKRYFATAKEVGSLTRILCAKLEQARQKSAPMSLSGAVLSSRGKLSGQGTTGFGRDSGRLTVLDPASFEQTPALMLKLFELADQFDLDIHPDALAACRKSLRRIDVSVRQDEQAIASFLAVLTSRRNPGSVLRLMNEAGVLGRFVPEFGRIVARTQFNMYHHYTVDEHTLRAIEVISDIEHGRFVDEHPLSTEIFPFIQNRRALYLAMLLHDTGKGRGDQCIEGEKSTRAACRRLGLPEQEVELASWLVRWHLAMSDAGQKRDLSDPRTIEDFAQLVQTPERLRLLLVLTVADIRAVGEGVWNGWKGQLLRELYRLTEAGFRGGRSLEAAIVGRMADRAGEAVTSLKARLAAQKLPMPAWMENIEHAYWLSVDDDSALWHAAVAAQNATSAIQIATRVLEARNVTEVFCVAPDRPGLFASFTGAIAAASGSVVDARAFTTQSGLAVDVFSVQDFAGEPFGADDGQRLQRLTQSLHKVALSGDVPSPASTTSQTAWRRAAAFNIEPVVAFDNEASSDCTVIEISGRDRPGLLRDLALAMGETGVAISSAHIESVGERAVDAFYVRTPEGGKITQTKQLDALRERIERALRANAPEAPTNAARRILARARASDAR